MRYAMYEFSTVAATILNSIKEWIHCEYFKFFDAITVLLFGDLRQLPTSCGSLMYSSLGEGGGNNWAVGLLSKFDLSLYLCLGYVDSEAVACGVKQSKE